MKTSVDEGVELDYPDSAASDSNSNKSSSAWTCDSQASSAGRLSSSGSGSGVPGPELELKQETFASFDPGWSQSLPLCQVILASDWSTQITWPEYCPLIGWDRSRDLNTLLWLVHFQERGTAGHGAGTEAGLTGDRGAGHARHAGLRWDTVTDNDTVVDNVATYKMALIALYPSFLVSCSIYLDSRALILRG